MAPGVSLAPSRWGRLPQRQRGDAMVRGSCRPAVPACKSSSVPARQSPDRRTQLLSPQGLCSWRPSWVFDRKLDSRGTGLRARGPRSHAQRVWTRSEARLSNTSWSPRAAGIPRPLDEKEINNGPGKASQENFTSISSAVSPSCSAEVCAQGKRAVSSGSAVCGGQSVHGGVVYSLAGHRGCEKPGLSSRVHFSCPSGCPNQEKP
jgi:hypothetical protein